MRDGYQVRVNKYAHEGSAFSRPLYELPTEWHSLNEAKRIADERAACGVDRFVIVVDGGHRIVYNARVS